MQHSLDCVLCSTTQLAPTTSFTLACDAYSIASSDTSCIRVTDSFMFRISPKTYICSPLKHFTDRVFFTMWCSTVMFVFSAPTAIDTHCKLDLLWLMTAYVQAPLTLSSAAEETCKFASPTGQHMTQHRASLKAAKQVASSSLHWIVHTSVLVKQHIKQHICHWTAANSILNQSSHHKHLSSMLQHTSQGMVIADVLSVD